MRKTRDTIGDNLFLGVISCIFVVLFSGSTSFLYKGFGHDSAIFFTVGKCWAEGKIPYVDVFDHKGPVIFFINMLGYQFTGNYLGVLAIQFVSMFFLCKLIQKFLFLENKTSGKYRFFLVLTLGILACFYECGNLTEEYILPLLTLSLYYQVLFLKDPLSQHNPMHSFVYGLCTAVAFLTRITNAIPVLIGIFVILVLLVCRRKWKNILQNAAAYLIGFGVLTLPFVLYFAKHNAFYAFLWGTIGFNLHYVEGTANRFLSGRELFKFIAVFFPAYILPAAGIREWIRKNKSLALFYILLGVAETVFFACGKFYPHYAMILIPNVLILFLSFYNEETKPVLQRIVLSGILVYAALCTAVGIYQLPEMGRKWENTATSSAYAELMEHVDGSEAFVAYNADNNVYALYDLIPCYKYCFLQDWQGSFSDITRNDIHKVFSACDAEWILARGYPIIIRDILEKDYFAFEQGKDGYVLYKRK